MTTIYFDPMKTNKPETLSNNNLTIKTVAATFSKLNIPSERNVFVVEFNVDIASGGVIGIGDGSTIRSQFPGSDSKSLGIAMHNGQIWFNNVGGVTTSLRGVVGERLAIKVNKNTNIIEFYQNGIQRHSMTIPFTFTDLYIEVGSGGTFGAQLTLIPNYFDNNFIYGSGILAYYINKKTLVKHNDEYLTYKDNDWLSLNTTNLIENDFLQYGIDTVSDIQESSWFKLQGLIELLHFTDDLNKTEVSFNVETEPFTLYEEFGDEIDILYYTGDPDKTSAALQLTANYSPLDELTDPSLIIWTNNTSKTQKTVNVTAVPKPQLVIPITDYNIIGTLKKLELIANSHNLGMVKFVFSGDGGVTWKTIKSYEAEGTHVINTIPSLNIEDVKKYGAKPEYASLLTESELKTLFSSNKIRVAYYISQSRVDDIAEINKLTSDQLITTESPELSQLIILYDELDAKYSGLMFMDVSQQYYSTSIGEILKYLNFGTLIAGQTSLIVNVKLTNTYPFDVENIVISSETEAQGVNVQLSRSNNPFINEGTLHFDRQLLFDEVIDFYVRIQINANSVGQATFDIKVEADPV